MAINLFPYFFRLFIKVIFVALFYSLFYIQFCDFSYTTKKVCALPDTHTLFDNNSIVSSYNLLYFYHSFFTFISSEIYPIKQYGANINAYNKT